MQIGLERIRLSFPLDLTIKGVEVLTSPADTLLTLEEASVRVNPLPLIRKIVSVESLHLKEAQVNTGTFIEGMVIKGRIDDLSAAADYINLAEEKATLNSLDLSGTNISLQIDSISQKEDTTSTPMNWKIQLGDIALEKVAFALAMPADSIWLNAFIDDAKAGNGLVDLGISRYTVGRFRLSDSDVRFDRNQGEPLAGIDPNHIVLSQLNADIQSIVYQDKDIEADIQSFSVAERSGLEITSLIGKVQSDSVQIVVPELELKTAESSIRVGALVPWSLMDSIPSTQDSVQLSVSAALAKEDIFLVVPDLPADFKRAYPAKPVNVTAWGQGTLESFELTQIIAELPGVLEMSGAGTVGNVMDSVRRSADVQLEVLTHDMSFILSYLPKEQRGQYRIPPGMRLRGEASLHNQAIQANLRLTEDKANVLLAGRYNMTSEAYAADIRIENLEPIHFMPNDSIMWVDAQIKAEGQGTDIYSPRMHVDFSATIDSVQYVNTTLSDITLEGSLKDNKANVTLNSDNQALDLNLIVDGTITREEVDGMIILDADNIDLYGLHFMDTTFNTTFNLFGEFKSNYKERNQADLTIGNWDINSPDIRMRQQILTLKARSDEDTTQVSLHTGDLGVTLTGNAGLNTMIDQFKTVADEFNRQLTVDSIINIAALRPSLPDMDLRVTAKRDNAVYRLLQRYYINFTDINLYASTSPEEGIRMDAGVYAFARDTFLIDTIRANIRPDTAGLVFGVDVIKKRYRRQTPFKANVSGSIKDRYADAELTFWNQNDSIGLNLGVSATKETEGYTFRLFPEHPIIAFNTFDLNEDNYVHFRSMSDIDANIRLTGQENTSFWIHSTPSEGSLPELHVEIGQLNLAALTQGIDLLPNMRGILNADVRYAPTDETFLVVADANVDDLYYEDGRVGEVMVNAVYLPLENSEHQFDVHLYHDQQEVMTAYAMYNAAQTANNIDGALDITTLPLMMANAFIPDNMAELNGALNGHMEIKGSSSSPVLNGYIQMDSSSVYVGMADTRLRLDDRQITVKNSLISFNKYNIYSTGDNPFVIDGNVDMSNFSRMMADLKMTASNMQVLDARRTTESIVYGKLFMDFNTTIKGPFNGLVVRGDAHLLGGTDVTYVLTDSPLTVKDRMDGLVTFTSFADTLTRERRNQGATGVSGIDMLMVLHIDPTVQARVDLTPDQSNFVEVEGGGDLTFQMNQQGDMVLNGRYTFSEGIVNYTLPVVPLKEFNIHQGSYVQWDGEVLNPLIDVVATERMRATVTRDGNQNRRNFDVGISVQDRLDNMQLGFIIDAVDDQQAMTELSNLGEDERTRWAIYMMITGSYMGSDASAGGVNVDAVIGNFLMGEINNIAGDVLKGVDINLGLDTYESEGQTQRDLTFSFSKRFYNDRIRVTVGGKVATAATAQQAESFLDNFAAEYLLDAAGSKTVKFFHDRNYDMLEGEIVQTGVGLVLRRKVLRLRELFDFRKKKTGIVTEDDADTGPEPKSLNELETRPTPEEEKEDATVEPDNVTEDETKE